MCNRSVVSSYQQPESTAHSSAPSIEKLPDASMLLNSPVFSSNMFSGGDHSSRVAAAIAESASRKRESNEFVSSVPRSKVPRGNLPHSKNVPDTIGGMLVPPQLSGRLVSIGLIFAIAYSASELYAFKKILL